jgi:tRNA dimethylallyltransferase
LYVAEIISADCAKVYKEMNSATSKPSISERLQVRHHLIDIRSPSQSFSNGEFQEDAKKAVQSVNITNISNK